MQKTIAIFFLVLIAVPAYAATEERTQCSVYKGRDKARCESRAQERGPARRFRLLERSTNRATEMRGTVGRMRLQEREQRNQDNAARLSSRNTFRELKATTDHNTTRRVFLNSYRRRQLNCMLERPGRSRRLCLEEARDNVRKIMRSDRGTIKNYKP